MKNERCENCRFFWAYSLPLRERELGECRRYAPHSVRYHRLALWTQIAPDNSCGEWQPLPGTPIGPPEAT